MKKILTFLLLFSICTAFSQQAQSRVPGYKITYIKSSNGKIIENQDRIMVLANAKTSVITTEKISTQKAAFPYEITLIDQGKNRYTQLARLSHNKTAATIDSTSISKQSMELTNETKTILGYKCRKAKTIINSNTIELWYTNELGITAAPTVLGHNLGLVLEMVRNGNYSVTATKIEKLKNITSYAFPAALEKSETVDLLTYRDLLWRSRFTTIKVFENEIINFSDASKSNDTIFRYANGTILLKKVTFPNIKKGSQIFVDVKEQSNGDAYDRTGSVFVIPMDQKLSFLDGLKSGSKILPVYDNGNGKQYQGVVRTPNYAPLLELMRFFTPFGIKQYNHIQLKDKTWEEAVPYRQDISELQPALSSQQIWVGTFIGNYDKGGHKISMNITIHEEENSVSQTNFLLPLFNTTNVMEMAGQEYGTMFNSDKGLVVDFVLEKEVKNARLRYITTGHGGWENGDEYLQKKNTILVDGLQVHAFIPWRQDCGSYRLYNPASGNFPNGLSSSDYSRSNWCPGMVTTPTIIELGTLAPGKHSIQIKIPQGAPEGTSFSAWNVSGVLLGE